MLTSQGSTRPSARSSRVRAIPSTSTGLGRERFQGSPEEKDLGVLVYEKLDMSCQCELWAQKAKHVLGCIQSSMDCKGRRRFCPSAVLCSGKVHLEDCIQLCGPQYRKDMDLPKKVQRRPPRQSDGWTTSAIKTDLRELGLFSLEKRRLWEDYSTF